MPKALTTFAIGFFASACAVFVPRMIAMLSDMEGKLQFFKPTYLLVGFTFAFTIGVITVIFEVSKEKTAAEIFMSALGIPALLSGVLNTGTVGNDVKALQQQNHELQQKAAQSSGIPINDGGTTITPLVPITGLNDTLFDFNLIPSALAGDDNSAQPATESSSLGILNEEKNYVIVLSKSSNRGEAMQKAQQLKQISPNATVVQAGQQFMVIDSPQPKNKTDALLRAIDLKHSNMQQPELLRIN